MTTVTEPDTRRESPLSKIEKATRHQRTRTDHAAETAEDYAEAIAEVIHAAGSCRIVDLTERFGITHVTVLRILRRLKRDGIVLTEPKSPVQLTPAGRKLARQSSDRHDVVLEFLRVIGVSKAVAEVDAEGIEHHVSPETLSRFKRIVKRSRS